MAKKAFSRGEKVLLTGAIILLALAGFVVFWVYYSNLNPVVSVPEPVLPSRNARDCYQAAYDLQVHTMTTGDGATLKITDIAAWIDGGIMKRPESATAGTPPPKLADMRALVRKNAPALAKMQEGLAGEYRAVQERMQHEKNVGFSSFNLARLLQADADLKCLAGDWDGAAEGYLDVIQLGGEIQRGAPVGTLIFSAAIQRLGRNDIWPILDRISGKEARRAAGRLGRITARRVPYTDVLQEEKWTVQAMMLEAFNTPDWRAFHSYLEGEGVRHYPGPGEKFRMMFTTKRGVMRDYTQYMDTLIANARMPYPAMRGVPPLPNDPMCRSLLSHYRTAWFHPVMDRAQNDLLMVAFVLRAYHADHGRYPASLKVLASSGYLKTIPADPFMPTGKLCYKATGKSYVLYSVGPDGKDDGGTPSADGITASGTRPTMLHPGSTGDIVAGVNKY